jgi:glycine/D-amino acid oxidase-like deaminating enzyme
MTTPMTTLSSKQLPASLWAATARPAPVYAPPAAEVSADVAVVGGGYTGLSAALHLAQRGARVALVEAVEPGWGASGRNGGQIIAGLKATIADLTPLFGADLARRMVVNMGGSADLVFSLIRKYNIDCHAMETGWIQAAHGPRPYRDIIRPRYEQWTSLGVPARLMSQADLATAIGAVPDAYHAGWHDPRGGVLQPLSFARGLADAVLREGAVIQTQTLVHRLIQGGGVWELATNHGIIRAPRVILATNAYSGEHHEGLWPSLTRTYIPVTSFQMATRPLDQRFNHILAGGAGVTDSRRLLGYFRRDHQDRLIMGSRSPVEDNPTREHARLLQRLIARLFPDLGEPEPEFIWSGKVAITKDRLPHIHLPADGLIAFMGCNGRGVGMCTMMGKMLADLAAGSPPAEVPFPVTVPDAFALHALRKLGVFALSQYYGFLDRLESMAR